MWNGAGAGESTHTTHQTADTAARGEPRLLIVCSHPPPRSSALCLLRRPSPGRRVRAPSSAAPPASPRPTRRAAHDGADRLGLALGEEHLRPRLQELGAVHELGRDARAHAWEGGAGVRACSSGCDAGAAPTYRCAAPPCPSRRCGPLPHIARVQDRLVVHPHRRLRVEDEDVAREDASGRGERRVEEDHPLPDAELADVLLGARRTTNAPVWPGSSAGTGPAAWWMDLIVTLLNLPWLFGPAGSSWLTCTAPERSVPATTRPTPGTLKYGRSGTRWSCPAPPTRGGSASG